MKKYTIILLVIATIITARAASAGEIGHAVCTGIAHTLSIGATDRTSKGDVTLLQDFLRVSGLLDHVSTGYFGSLTMQAVRDFQRANDIESIGIVGPKTRAAIKTASCTEPLTAQTNASSTPVTLEPLTAGATTTATSTPPVVTASLPFTSTSLSQWSKTWGALSSLSNGLLLQALPGATGAEAILRTSGEWSDYRYTINATVSNGDLTLIGRYRDADNFVACNFNRHEVAILERKNGETKLVAATVVDGMSNEAYISYVI
jgi:hypothetical protein